MNQKYTLSLLPQTSADLNYIWGTLAVQLILATLATVLTLP